MVLEYLAWDGDALVPVNLHRYTGDTGAPWDPPPPSILDPVGEYGAVVYVNADTITATEGDQLSAYSGAGRTFLAAGGGPIYREAGLGASPALEFFSQRRMICTDAALNLGAVFTVVCVVQSLPANANGMAWMLGEEATGKRRALYLQGQSGIHFSGYDQNVLVDGVTTLVPTVVTISRAANGLVRVRKNGAQIDSGVPALSAYAFNGFSIGANVSGTEPWAGRLGKLAAWAGDTLPDASRDEIEAAFLAQYVA